MNKLKIAQLALCLVPCMAMSNSSVLSGSTSRIYVANKEMKNHRYVCTGEAEFQANLTGNTADLDLYINKGSAAATTNYDCRSVNWGNSNESCHVDIYSSNTQINVGVYGYNQGSGVLTAGCISDFVQPCEDCGYSGPYDRDWHGDGLNHLGKDYPAFVGDPVQAIADGIVHAVYTNLSGFGGNEPLRDGPAVVVKHKKQNGELFYALYGHVHSSVTVGSKIKKGTTVGTVSHYFYGNEDWPHLHFGVWDSESAFPTSNLAYGTDRSFVDPVPFLINNKGMSIQ